MLQHVACLGDVPHPTLARLAIYFQVEEYPAGHVIIHQGDVADRITILSDGSAVGTIKRGAKMPKGFVATFSVYDSFGELSVLDEVPSKFTVTCSTQCKVVTAHGATYLLSFTFR